MFRGPVTPERPRARIMLADERRDRFEALAGEHKASFAELSRILGRNESYISDYLRRKVPYDLADADNAKLARFFGVDPAALRPQRQSTSLRSRVVKLPIYRDQDRLRNQDPDQRRDVAAEEWGARRRTARG